MTVCAVAALLVHEYLYTTLNALRHAEVFALRVYRSVETRRRSDLVIAGLHGCSPVVTAGGRQGDATDKSRSADITGGIMVKRDMLQSWSHLNDHV